MSEEAALIHPQAFFFQSKLPPEKQSPDFRVFDMQHWVILLSNLIAAVPIKSAEKHHSGGPDSALPSGKVTEEKRLRVCPFPALLAKLLYGVCAHVMRGHALQLFSWKLSVRD